jgi:hypothetical protein
MRTITDRFYDALENQLSEAKLNNEARIDQYRESVRISKKAMTKLKNYVTSYAFADTEEEIHFFKHIKPKFYSKYIYYNNIYNYHMKVPPGGEEALRAYIHKHLDKIKSYYDDNLSFYQYYRSGSTAQDAVFFTRGGFDVHPELEDFEEDEQYSTSHDYKIARIIANEKIQEYLNLEIALVGNHELVQLNGYRVFPFKNLQWSATPTDAAELLYALKEGRAINNGNIDINELVGLWEFIFEMEIKEPYHKLYDIGKRHKEMFVFLTRIKEALWNFIKRKFNKGLPPEEE